MCPLVQFLSTLPHQLKVLDEVASVELQLADLLGGGVRLSRCCARNPMPALTYLALLLKLTDRIRAHRQAAAGERDWQRLRRGALADVEMNIVRSVNQGMRRGLDTAILPGPPLKGRIMINLRSYPSNLC